MPTNTVGAPFVGRKPEMTRVTGLLDEARAGRGRLVLGYLERQLRGMRMLIVATCREQTSRLITMDANTERVELRGLGTEAIGELLTLAGLPAVRAVAVHAPTRGNALLTRELIRLLGEQPGNPPGMVPGAHAERFEAEQLFPAFRDAGLAPGLEEVTDFVTFDTDEFYLRA